MEMAFSFQHQKDKHSRTIFPVRNAGRGTSKDLSCVRRIVCNGAVRVWSLTRKANGERRKAKSCLAPFAHSPIAPQAPLDILFRTLIKGMMDDFLDERFFVR
jgi:hypothetical protein